jgi:hypothetical protein
MAKINKAYKNLLKIFFKKSFPIGQRMGIHITPNHFYYPIPDTRTLKDDLWQKQSELDGIDINEKGQIDLLSMLSSKFKREYESFPKYKTPISYQFYLNNSAFGPVDAEILYCMIRNFKPKKIFEIGSGNSTYLAAQATIKNKEEDDRECELIAYEPFPNGTLKAGFPGLSKLIPTKIQDIPLFEFDELKENDILFIDSSHVLKIGSDVQYEYLNILPKLNKGVIVHIHDIFLPAEYPREWILNEYRFWNEQYLLQAFLINNNAFDVLWAGSYMHLKHPDELEKAFSSYNKSSVWPGSFWMRKRI